jgi:hypothetical protein
LEKGLGDDLNTYQMGYLYCSLCSKTGANCSFQDLQNRSFILKGDKGNNAKPSHKTSVQAFRFLRKDLKNEMELQRKL